VLCTFVTPGLCGAARLRAGRIGGDLAGGDDFTAVDWGDPAKESWPTDRGVSRWLRMARE
jgi:hypothetical protein